MDTQLGVGEEHVRDYLDIYISSRFDGILPRPYMELAKVIQATGYYFENKDTEACCQITIL